MFTTAERRARDQLALPNGRLAVLACDQRTKLREARGGAGLSADDATLLAIKRDIVGALAGDCRAALLDPEIALPALIDEGIVPGTTGVIVSTEVSGAPWVGDERPARLLDGVGASGVRRLGGQAAKVLVYVRADRDDPDSANVRLVRDLVAECRRHDLLLVVESLVLRLPGEDEQRFRRLWPALVRDAALLLQEAGSPLLKLEFPGDERSCAEVTDVLTAPWALLSAGVDHETFCGQLRCALGAGAAGFIAGRSIWKECVTLGADDRRAFLADTGRRRLAELLEIAADA